MAGGANYADTTFTSETGEEWQLNNDPLVDVLQSEARIGCIRIGYLGYTRELKAEFIDRRGASYLLLDPYSESEYVFSGHPRLETVAWARKVGLWPEHLRAGETELAICSRMEARTGVAWPADLIPPRGGLFVHSDSGITVKDAPLRLAVTP